jgi:hypothetical protein
LSLVLDIHDHIIGVRGSDSTVLEKLRAEFHFFVTSERDQDFEVELLRETPPQIPALLATKVLEHASVYHLGPIQYVAYHDGPLAVWDTSRRKITLYAEDTERLYELSFLAVHSVLGQLAVDSGLVRMHAVAVSLNGVAAAVMLPSGGGKSTLLTHLLQNPELKVISDDMPLWDRTGKLHPFPSKISLGHKPLQGELARLDWQLFTRASYPPKWTASLAQLKARIERSPQDLPCLLVAGFRLSHGEGQLFPVSRWRMIAPLLEHVVIGMGLPQVIELFLRFQFTDALKLARHFLIRSFVAARILRRAECFHLYLGTDRDYNAQLVLQLLEEHSGASA